MQPSSSNSYAQGSTSDNTPIGPQHTPTSHQHVNYWSNVANSHAATYPVYHSTPYYPNNVYGTSYSYQYQYPYSQTHASSQPYWPQQYTGYSQPATSQFSHSNTMAPQITKSELNASSSTASNTNARSQRDASSAPAPAGCNIWAQRQISTVQSLDESKLSKAQKEIYEIVAKSKVNGTLWTKDWDLEPEIPCVQRLRRAFAGGEPDESSSAKNDAVVDEREPKSSTIDTLQHSSPEYSAFTPVYIPKKTSSAPFSSMPVYSTTATATTSTNAASKSSGSFEPSVPPSVQAWAQKQYEACAGNPAETKAVSREIFDRVREATLSNTLWTRDWTLEPPCATAQKYFGPSSAFVGATLTNFASVVRDFTKISSTTNFLVNLSIFTTILGTFPILPFSLINANMRRSVYRLLLYVMRVTPFHIRILPTIPSPCRIIPILVIIVMERTSLVGHFLLVEPVRPMAWILLPIMCHIGEDLRTYWNGGGTDSEHMILPLIEHRKNVSVRIDLPIQMLMISTIIHIPLVHIALQLPWIFPNQ